MARRRPDEPHPPGCGRCVALVSGASVSPNPMGGGGLLPCELLKSRYAASGVVLHTCTVPALPYRALARVRVLKLNRRSRPRGKRDCWSLAPNRACDDGGAANGSDRRRTNRVGRRSVGDVQRQRASDRQLPWRSRLRPYGRSGPPTLRSARCRPSRRSRKITKIPEEITTDAPSSTLIVGTSANTK